MAEDLDTEWIDPQPVYNASLVRTAAGHVHVVYATSHADLIYAERCE